MVTISLLIIIVCLMLMVHIVEKDSEPPCDQCLGDDCPFPNLPCERRNPRW